MSNQLHKKLHEAGRETRLTKEEQASMRAAIHDHFKTHPHSSTVQQSPYRFFFAHRAMSLIALVLVVMVGAGGTVLAAEGTLPGDLLYPVKLSVNEQVQTALARTPREKAEVNTILAERRVEEAQQLALRGSVSLATTQELHNNFSEHSDAAHTFVVEVAKSDPDEAQHLSTRLTSSMTLSNTVFATSTEDRHHDDSLDDNHSGGKGDAIQTTSTPSTSATSTEKDPDHRKGGDTGGNKDKNNTSSATSSDSSRSDDRQLTASVVLPFVESILSAFSATTSTTTPAMILSTPIAMPTSTEVETEHSQDSDSTTTLSPLPLSTTTIHDLWAATTTNDKEEYKNSHKEKERSRSKKTDKHADESGD